jgi:hypothetical protein
MAFNWTEYLTLAKFLQGDDRVSYSEEAARRAAVSRAYYAAFCSARNYACCHLSFPSSKKGKDHRDLIMHFKIIEMIDPRISGIADNLAELRQWRNSCDYDDEMLVLTDLSSLVKSALDDAQEIIDLLK